MNLPENPLVEKHKVLEVFQITDSNLKSMLYAARGKAGKMKPPVNGKFHLNEVASYILSRQNGKAQTKAYARKVKEFYALSHPVKSESVHPTKVKAEIDVDLQTGEEGIEHALKRVQKTEAQLAVKVQESIHDPALMGDNLRNWNQSLEILRKTEVDCLKVLEEKRTLIRLDEAISVYDKGILPVKTRLMALPVQLSTMLEGQDAATIQSIMEKQITKALEDISNVWTNQNQN